MLSVADFVQYGAVGLVAGFVLKRVISMVHVRRMVPGLIQQGAVVIDVRSPAEFSSGHAAGSRNIPLADLEHTTKELDPNRWIIVCCASGTRSGMARRWLLRHGFQRVLNAGSWRDLP